LKPSKPLPCPFWNPENEPGFGCRVPENLTDRAKVLDNFYVPTRYANGHPEGPPFEH
jgi:hypothetical protein